MGFTDALRQMLDQLVTSMHITSAGGDSPKVNVVRDYDLNPDDFEDLIQSEVEKAVEKAISKAPQFKEVKETQEAWQDGNVGQLQNMSNRAFSNVKSVASDPFGFIFALLAKRIIKLVSVVGFVLLIAEIVKFAVAESMKPGRILDRRFKRLAQEEVFQFWTHQEQQKLKQGFTDVRVTSHSGLRGGASQVNGNLFQHQSVSGTLGPPTEYVRDVDPNQGNPTRSYTSSRDGNPMSYRRLYR